MIKSFLSAVVLIRRRRVAISYSGLTSWPLRIIMGVVLAVVSAMAMGGVEPAARSYYTVERDDLLRVASDLDLPSGATKANEPFLYFHLGPTRLDFFALSVAQGDPKEFAEIADLAIRKGLGRELPIRYSLERGQMVLDSDENRAKPFQRNAMVSIDFEAIQAVFQAHGLKPKILLRTATYYELSGFRSKGKSKRTKLYFDGTDLGRVDVWESLSPFAALSMVLFLVWPALCITLGVKVGLRQGKDLSVPIAVRRKRYEKMVWGSVILGIGLHMPLFIWLYASGKLDVLSELWTGGTLLRSFAPFVMLASISAMSWMVKRTDKEEAELMGYDLKLEEAKKAYRKKTTRLGGMVAMGLGLLGFCAFVIIISTYREPRFAILALLLPVLIGIALMPPLEKYMSKKIPFEAGDLDSNPEAQR